MYVHLLLSLARLLLASHSHVIRKKTKAVLGAEGTTLAASCRNSKCMFIYELQLFGVIRTGTGQVAVIVSFAMTICIVLGFCLTFISTTPPYA